MAPRRKIKLSDLPEAGAVFAFPLADGRFGACRVIRVNDENAKDWPLCVLVAASPWIGSALPSIDDPALQETLVLSHHSWVKQPEVLWMGEPPPPEFQRVGTLPKASARGPGSKRFGGWQSFPYQVLMQWRWTHDHARVAAEDVVSKAEASEKRVKAQTERKDYLAAVTLEQLRAKRFFPEWREYPPRAAKQGVIEILKGLVDALGARPRPLEKAWVVERLRECVVDLNALDERRDGFIETEEREDIILALEEILNAAGHADVLECVDEWRDW